MLLTYRTFFSKHSSLTCGDGVSADRCYDTVCKLFRGTALSAFAGYLVSVFGSAVSVVKFSSIVVRCPCE
jgi:hypothetical protein